MTSSAVPQQSTLRARIHEFFHAEEIPYGLALLRMIAPFAILCDMLPRWSWTREMYSSDGTPMPLWVSYDMPAMFPAAPAAATVASHSILLLVLVSAMIGWRTRTSLVTALIIYTFFNFLDSVSTLTKYTVISTHVLLLLSLSRCGTVWSIDSLLTRRRERAEGLSDEAMLAARRSPLWPTRLIQLLCGIIYFGAAFTKFHTPAFFSGDQMYHWLMTDYNSDHPFGHWMSMFPWFLAMTSYVTIIWEILFLFLAWKGLGRTICLIMGTGFHLGTLFLLGLYIFPLVSIPIYFAFYREAEYDRLFNALRRWRMKFANVDRAIARLQQSFANLSLPKNAGSWSQPAFYGLLAIVAVGGVSLERRLDLYGEHRPEGPYSLTKLDRDFVEGSLLRPSTPLRDKDKFNALSLGTFTVGGILADSRTEFRQGDRIIAQTILVPPHEDLWVDFGLQDGQGRVIDVVGMPTTHDMLRNECPFVLPYSLDPGEYAIVVKSAGKEVLRRKFTLLPGKSAVTAAAN